MSDASLHELLSAWMDGRLTGSEQARAEKLVSEDPHCAELVRQWKSQREQIRSLPRYKLDHDFSDRVLSKANLSGDVNRSALANQTTKPFANKPSSNFFASHSALGAISALAAMLLLTLFVFPVQLPEKSGNEFAMRTSVPPESGPPALAAVEGDARIDEPLAMKSGDFAAGVESLSSLKEQKAAPAQEAPVELAKNNPAFGGGAPAARGLEMSKSRERFAGGESQASQNVKELAGDASESSNAINDPLASSRRASEKQKPDASRLQYRLDDGEADNMAQSRVARDSTEQNAGVDFQGQAGQHLQGGAEITLGTQLANNSVNEVWFVDIKEPLSFSRLAEAMRQNKIAYLTQAQSPMPQFESGRMSLQSIAGEVDSNVQAIYLIASPSQMRGAITMLSEHAEINSFPVPNEISLEQASKLAFREGYENESREESQQDISSSADTSIELGRGALAQQLPYGLRLSGALDPAKKVATLNLGDDVGIRSSQGRVEDAAGSKVSEEAKQSIIPAAPAVPGTEIAKGELSDGLYDAEDLERDANNKQKKWYEEEEEKLLAGKQAAGSGDRTKSTIESPPELQQRYLLLIRFDSATPSQSEAVPADASK